MTSSSALRLAADGSRPLGARVRALCWSLEVFAPFGFRSTMDRLVRVCGAPGGRFDEESFARALALVGAAKADWSAFAQATLAESRRAGHGPTVRGMHALWALRYFADETRARAWDVHGLGDCPRCGHPYVVHTTHCGGCDLAGDDDRCYDQPLPWPDGTQET